MLQNSIIRFLVVPLQSLQKSEHIAALIIVASGQFQIFALKELFEICDVGFLTLAQRLTTGENQTLVVAGGDHEEDIFEEGLVGFGFLADQLVVLSTFNH